MRKISCFFLAGCLAFVSSLTAFAVPDDPTVPFPEGQEVYSTAAEDVWEETDTELPETEGSEEETEAPESGTEAETKTPEEAKDPEEESSVSAENPEETVSSASEEETEPEIPTEAEMIEDEELLMNNAAPLSEVAIRQQAHVQDIGWQTAGSNQSGFAGTTGKSLRLEAIRLSVDPAVAKLGIQYQVYVKGSGWQNWASDGATAGTEGKSLPLQMIRISLTGEAAEQYDVYYRVHLAWAGWLDWAKDGEIAGSQGYDSYVIEAVELKVLPKGSSKAPANTAKPYVYMVNVYQQAHVQNIGWQGKSLASAGFAGTTGKSLWMEAIKLSTDQVGGVGISYQVYVRGKGWMASADGGEAGTTGQSLPIERFKASLTGANAGNFDLYYRVHLAEFGWLNWTKNGAEAGIEGYDYPIQAVEIRVVEKGASAPGSTGIACIRTPDVTYRANVSGTGWMSYVSNGQTAGTTGQSRPMHAWEIGISGIENLGVKSSLHISDVGWQGYMPGNTIAGYANQEHKIEAIKMELTGASAQYYNIWYRVHSANLGWMGWACNGAEAGTEGYAYAAEAIEVRILPKFVNAPGSTNNTFSVYVPPKPESEATIRAKQVLNVVGWDLRSAYNWSVSIPYQTIGNAPGGVSHTEWYGNYGFQNSKGNCYVKAATFCCMARVLGYEAYLVEGQVPLASGRLGPHGWCEIVINGTTYICDPELQSSTKRNGYMLTYGASGTYRYTNYGRVD